MISILANKPQIKFMKRYLHALKRYRYFLFVYLILIVLFINSKNMIMYPILIFFLIYLGMALVESRNYIYNIKLDDQFFTIEYLHYNQVKEWKTDRKNVKYTERNPVNTRHGLSYSDRLIFTDDTDKNKKLTLYFYHLWSMDNLKQLTSTPKENGILKPYGENL